MAWDTGQEDRDLVRQVKRARRGVGGRSGACQEQLPKMLVFRGAN